MKTLSYGLLLCMICGCGGGQLSSADRLKAMVPNAKETIPVSGKVLVDGKPVPELWVSLIPKGAKIKQAQDAESRGQTDEDGNFKITTYMDGDGAPAGDYAVVIEWLRFRQTGGQWIGPDKLGNRYSNPEKSKFAVTVGADPVEIPTLELTSK